MAEFSGKNVLVTGASSGIGWHTAKKFAEAGGSVLAHYHSNAEGAGKLSVPTVQADLGVTVDPLREAVTRHFKGRVDILVNNAGSLLERRKILEMDEGLWDRVQDLNLKSTFLCCRAFVPGMVERGQGAVVNVSSIAGRNGGGPGATAYATAKGGMITFTKGFAKEVAASGVRVNAVAPGVIQTPFHERFSTPAVMEAFVKSIPLGRVGSSEEVADVILFLASPRAAYLIGETIEVNGGMLVD